MAFALVLVGLDEVLLNSLRAFESKRFHQYGEVGGWHTWLVDCFRPSIAWSWFFVLICAVMVIS